MYLATAGEAPTLVDLLLISVGVGVCLLLLSLRRLSGDVVLHRPRHIGLLLVSARNGAVLAGVDLAAFVIGRGDVWLASYAFTPVDATSYSTASVLAFQITVPVGLATIALAPSVARLWSEDRISELRDLLNATATLSLAFTSAVVGVLWFVAPVAVTTLYGADLRSAALLLNVLSTGAIAIAAFGSSSILLIMTGHGRQAAIAAVSSVVLAVPIGVLASHQGPLSLALASAAASPLLVVLQWLLARRLVGFAPTPSHRVDRAWEVLRRGQQSSEGTPA
jgi:O-antigen/teichoic acid export membrane protein